MELKTFILKPVVSMTRVMFFSYISKWYNTKPLTGGIVPDIHKSGAGMSVTASGPLLIYVLLSFCFVSFVSYSDIRLGLLLN